MKASKPRAKRAYPMPLMVLGWLGSLPEGSVVIIADGVPTIIIDEHGDPLPMGDLLKGLAERTIDGLDRG